MDKVRLSTFQKTCLGDGDAVIAPPLCLGRHFFGDVRHGSVLWLTVMTLALPLWNGRGPSKAAQAVPPRPEMPGRGGIQSALAPSRATPWGRSYDGFRFLVLSACLAKND